MGSKRANEPMGHAAISVDEDTELLNTAPLSTEDKQDAIIAAQATSNGHQAAVRNVPDLAAGVPVGTKTTSAAAWDNGDELDLGAAHAYQRVRIDAVEDTYIVLDNSTSDPATTGGFVPAGSYKVYPVVGVRYIHHKAVSAAGIIGADAFAASA